MERCHGNINPVKPLKLILEFAAVARLYPFTMPVTWAYRTCSDGMLWQVHLWAQIKTEINHTKALQG